MHAIALHWLVVWVYTSTAMRLEPAKLEKNEAYVRISNNMLYYSSYLYAYIQHVAATAIYFQVMVDSTKNVDLFFQL